MKRVLLAAALAVAAVAVFAGCGSRSVASPLHQVNVFADGMNHSDFRQVCSVVYIKSATAAQCENYFLMQTAIAGVGHAEAVPHSTVYQSATDATVKLDVNGRTYTASLTVRHGHWLLTSVR